MTLMNLNASLISLLIAFLILTAGCTQPFTVDNQSPDLSVNHSGAKFRQTIAQPEDSAILVKTETDVYTVGDVVKFSITNDRAGDISCLNDPPSFSVRYQDGTGRWVFRMGGNPLPGNSTNIKPGESTLPASFVTTGWAPGRYRIASDCGVSREILLLSPAPVVTTGTQCPVRINQSPFIRVNVISEQSAGVQFTISGTTSLKPGKDLRYSLFAIMEGTGNVTSAKLVSSTVPVSPGSCGINTWSVTGVIKVPGNYFIGISDAANTISAVRRFAVSEKANRTETPTLPVKTTEPGIITG